MRKPGADSTVSISGSSRSPRNCKTSANLKHENRLAGQLTLVRQAGLTPRLVSLRQIAVELNESAARANNPGNSCSPAVPPARSDPWKKKPGHPLRGRRLTFG